MIPQEPEYFSDDCGYDPAACPPDSQREYIQEVCWLLLFAIIFNVQVHPGGQLAAPLLCCCLPAMLAVLPAACYAWWGCGHPSAAAGPATALRAALILLGSSNSGWPAGCAAPPSQQLQTVQSAALLTLPFRMQPPQTADAVPAARAAQRPVPSHVRRGEWSSQSPTAASQSPTASLSCRCCASTQTCKGVRCASRGATLHGRPRPCIASMNRPLCLTGLLLHTCLPLAEHPLRPGGCQAGTRPAAGAPVHVQLRCTWKRRVRPTCCCRCCHCRR